MVLEGPFRFYRIFEKRACVIRNRKDLLKALIRSPMMTMATARLRMEVSLSFRSPLMGNTKSKLTYTIKHIVFTADQIITLRKE